MYGKTHTEETRNKISESLKGKQSGKRISGGIYENSLPIDAHAILNGIHIVVNDGTLLRVAGAYGCFANNH